MEIDVDFNSQIAHTSVYSLRYYYTDELQMTLPYRIFNTWMGDPAKLLQLKTIIDVVKRDALLDNAVETGHVLLNGFQEIQERYTGLVSRARGQGTLCAVDICSTKDRDALVAHMRNLGVLVGGLRRSDHSTSTTAYL